MRQTDKSLQSEKFKQVVEGWENHLGKAPPPTESNLPEIWTGHSLAGPDRDILGRPPGVCCPQLRGHAPSNWGPPTATVPVARTATALSATLPRW